MNKLLLFLLTSSFMFSCNNRAKELSIASNIKKEISEGVKKVSNSDKSTYNQKLDALIKKCSEPEFSEQNNPYKYQLNEEYTDYKNFVSSSPDMYYLLADTYLKNNTGGYFHWMFVDIIESRYPDVVMNTYKKIEMDATAKQFDQFPTICIAYLLEEIKREK